MIEWGGSPITDGTSQESRFPQPLREGYIHVDEMSFEDLLATSAEFADCLRFIDSNNQHTGSWGELFRADEVVMMAQILSMDLTRQESEFLPRLRGNVRESVSQVIGIATRVDQWFTQLNASDHEAGKALSWKILEVIENPLRGDVQRVAKMLEEQDHSLTQDRIVGIRDFNPVWGIHVEGDRFQLPDSDVNSVATLPHEHEVVHSAFYSLIHAISYLQKITPQYVQASLRSQDHQPAIGLFMGFLKLFQQAQRKCNRYPQEHLKFYYEQCLQLKPKSSTPDRAHVILEPLAHGGQVVIPKGTAFTAGHDSQQREMVYISDQDLRVTDATIREMHSLHFEHNPLLSPEKELGWCTRVHTQSFPILGETPKGTHVSAFSLFGADEREKTQKSWREDVLGFALTSTVLLLKEGSRTLEITFQLVDRIDEDEQLTTLLKHWQEKKVSEEEIGHRLFERYLELYREEAKEKWSKDWPETVEQFIRSRPSPRMSEFVHLGRPDLWHNAFLIELLEWARTEEEFFGLFGKFMSRYLLMSGDGFTEEDKSRIVESVQRMGEHKTMNLASVSLIDKLIKQDRQSLFYSFLDDLFTICVTGESGWLTVTDYGIEPLRTAEGTSQLGFICCMTFGPDKEAIVPYALKRHGGNWETDNPIIQFHLNPQAKIYPYSLFQHAQLQEVGIIADVKGVKEVLVYNQQGQLDASKPFHPFGALPTSNAYMVVGNYEMGKKNVTKLYVDIEWGDVPKEAGGFEQYYQGYPTPISHKGLQAEVSVLNEGQWQPIQKEKRSRVPLFNTQNPGGRIGEQMRLPIREVSLYQPLSSDIAEEDFTYDVRANRGFFMLALSGGESAFGHKAYPGLLTKVLTENAKRKHPQPLPREPYTPLVNRIQVAYTAEHHMLIEKEWHATEKRGNEKIFHLHPFGKEEVYPGGKEASPFFLPQYQEAGNLYLGLSSYDLGGTLTILFDVAKDSTREMVVQQPETSWWYLASNQWRRLEDIHVMSDTTNGFLTSGIVTLQIPQDIDRNNTIFPKELFWLRLSATRHLQSFGRVRAIYAHAVSVTWQDQGNASDHLENALPAGMIQKLASSIPGVRGIRQVGESFGGMLGETPRQMNTRMSERLRHKNRASMPWDYERLVLEQFPEIFKVKCFSHMESGQLSVRPGHVLVVVVPHVTSHDHEKTFTPMVSADTLNHIQTYIQELSSPFVKLEVRNPIYERIQVRCTLKLVEGVHRGITLQKVNQAIIHFLSPWHEGGYHARFGWQIKQEDIETIIRGIESVEFVTNFSMLHITEDEEGKFTLGDTARQDDRSTKGADQVAFRRNDFSQQISPRYPWSLAIPTNTHFLETTTEMKLIKPEMTGLDEMEVGLTFILE